MPPRWILPVLLSCALLGAGARAAAPAKGSAPAKPPAAASAAAPAKAGAAASAGESSPPPAARPTGAAPVLTAEQITEILDETVQWYRTLGSQQQLASEPSDLLIVFANRQAADKVVAQSFQIARANAELLSSEASAASSGADAAVPALQKRQSELKARLKELDRQIAAARGAPASARLSELESERAMIAARENLLENLYDFANQSDPRTAGAEALKSEIDAIAASIPAESSSTQAPAPAPVPVRTPGAPASTSSGAAAASQAASAAGAPGEREGLWALATHVMALRRKIQTIDAIDAQTEALSATFERIAAPARTQLKELATQSDALAGLADRATGAQIQEYRSRFDTLAWLIQQSTAIVVPLSQEQVLLKEYRHNLANWRDATRRRLRDAWGALGVRLGVLGAMIVALLVLGDIWRRAVLRYVQDVQRRYQFLIVRRIVIWALVLCLIGLSIVSSLSSFAVFAGLLTAGAAVALQSVLVSVVGYFFLIGKYGVRVGDRIQIGAVIGEVIDLGLVRMHLLELNPGGVLGPTGRVVGFPNLVVFQGTGGLFRQIPGVSLSWREITLTLPVVSDYAQLKEKLLEAVKRVVESYRDEIERQSKAIESKTVVSRTHEWEPQVQMHLLLEGRMQALVRYPAHLSNAAEIDERVSEALLEVIASAEGPRSLPVS